MWYVYVVMGEKKGEINWVFRGVLKIEELYYELRVDVFILKWDYFKFLEFVFVYLINYNM